MELVRRHDTGGEASVCVMYIYMIHYLNTLVTVGRGMSYVITYLNSLVVVVYIISDTLFGSARNGTQSQVILREEGCHTHDTEFSPS